jgi:hypothetical protein
MDIKEEIKENGYIVIDLMDLSELDQLSEIVFDEFSRALKVENILNPIKSKMDLINYHNFNLGINHGDFWPKSKRIIGKLNLIKVIKMPFMQNLKNILGDFKISNEEGIQNEEIYWRIVRPNNREDIGPIHADKWFWDAMDNSSISNENIRYERLKLWMPLYSEVGVSGLKVVKKSHLNEYDHSVKKVNGRVKFEAKSEDNYDLEVLEIDPGQAVIFHDNLLHGGSVGIRETRVSLEFTILKKMPSDDN